MAKPVSSKDIKHKNDYYYRKGMSLRPIPPAKDEFSWVWRHCRHHMFGPWYEVEDEFTPTPQSLLFDDHMWQGDELMDAVVDMFGRLGSKEARRLFDQAIDQGIESLDNPPEELRALLEDAYRVPDWWDPAKAERGRRRMTSSTLLTIVIVGTFAIFDTVMNADVSASTGASGRFRDEGPQRVVETARFFGRLFDRDAFTPGGDGMKLALRVRLVHSLARKGLRSAWGEEQYAQNGNPISNSSMLGFLEAASLGALLIDHRHGRPCTLEDLDDSWHHTLRWAHVFGVAEELIPRTGLDAMHNLDYLLARSGNSSPWRTELVEVGLGAINRATSAVPGGETLLGPILTRVGSLFLSATGSVIMGPEAMDEFFRDTGYQWVDHRLAGLALKAVAIPVSHVAAMRDKIPGIGVVRRLVHGAAIPNPGNYIKLALDVAEKPLRVKTTFAMHDGNTSGRKFTAA
ncbi:oxygenase MpaB family protein [Mycobacterium sp. NPDC050853]|uniref:oxygenase MpaB family protein n=1 Tax=Mycobacterium sp. NPDC050853 TaxID=3155160 RepID=UPI0033F744BD